MKTSSSILRVSATLQALEERSVRLGSVILCEKQSISEVCKMQSNWYGLAVAALQWSIKHMYTPPHPFFTATSAELSVTSAKLLCKTAFAYLATTRQILNCYSLQNWWQESNSYASGLYVYTIEGTEDKIIERNNDLFIWQNSTIWLVNLFYPFDWCLLPDITAQTECSRDYKREYCLISFLVIIFFKFTAFDINCSVKKY